MKRAALFLFLVTVTGTASATTTWTVKSPATRATIFGGPWVLAQGTMQDPLAGWPTPNPTVNAMQPYYQPFVTGDEKLLQGYFDYRVKDTEEAIVSAVSLDLGATWTFQTKALDFVSPSIASDASAASDDGEGHPFVMTVAGKTRLYTLDRAAPFVDNLGLIVRDLAATKNDPLAGVPQQAQEGSQNVTRTTGLVKPDGILGVVPGSSPTRVLYLEKDISVTPNVTRLHLAQTTDGLAFTNDSVVAGITDGTTTFVGPRGSIVRYDDGRYGLFFSAGLAGEDPDAFHYVGYAESNDLASWQVVHGVMNPLLSIDPKADPTGGQSWYAGRVYAPNVILRSDGCTAVVSFSGYTTTKPKNAPNDYRQIGRLEIAHCTPMPAGDAGMPNSDAGAPSPDAGVGADAGADAKSNGCNVGGGSGEWIVLVSALARIGRSRRRPSRWRSSPSGRTW